MNNMKTQKYMYVVIDDDSRRPIVVAPDTKTLEAMLDEYCGAIDKYNHSGKRIEYVPYNTKYPDDYEGYYLYEITSYLTHGQLEVYKEKYHVYCVESSPVNIIKEENEI